VEEKIVVNNFLQQSFVFHGTKKFSRHAVLFCHVFQITGSYPEIKMINFKEQFFVCL